MFRRQVFRSCLVSAVFWLALAGRATDGCAQAPEDAWSQMQTEHFRLLSNAGARTTSKIAVKLEQLRQVLAATTGGSVDSPAPTLIFVFKDEASFGPYKLAANGKPDSIAGYYLGQPFVNYIAMDASAGEAPFRTIYHEFVHYYVRNNMPYIPLWLNEGLAEYYSTFKVDGNKAQLGLPIDEHRYWLSQYQLIPLNQLFKIDQNSPDYAEGARRGTFYAQSWALAHYLMTDPARRTQMGTLLGELRKGATADDAFKTAYATDLVALEKEVGAAYTTGRGLGYVELKLDQDVEAGSVTDVPISRSEVLCSLGDLLVQRRYAPPGQAEQLLLSALKADSTRALAHASLGQLHHEQEREAEAAHQHFDRAVAIAPDDAHIRLRYDLALLEEYFVPGKSYKVSAETTPPPLLAAREQLRRGMELAPQSVEDDLAFGRTFLLDRGQVFEGISALTTVVNREPWRLDAVESLVILISHSGNSQAARSLLDRQLRPRGTPEMVRDAEMGIADQDLRDAKVLANQQQFAEARVLLERTVAQTQDESVRNHVEAFLVEIDRAAGGSSAKR